MSLASSSELVILFGSHAKGTSHPESDVDVAVLRGTRALTVDEKLAVVRELSRRPDLPQGVMNLVDLHTASPLLEQEIAQEGKLVAGDPSVFIRFRVRAWKRYQDSAKFRRIRLNHLNTLYVK